MRRDQKMGQWEVRDFDPFFCQSLMCRTDPLHFTSWPIGSFDFTRGYTHYCEGSEYANLSLTQTDLLISIFRNNAERLNRLSEVMGDVEIYFDFSSREFRRSQKQTCNWVKAVCKTVCATQSHHVPEVILGDSVAGTISCNFTRVDT